MVVQIEPEPVSDKQLHNALASVMHYIILNNQPCALTSKPHSAVWLPWYNVDMFFCTPLKVHM